MLLTFIHQPSGCTILKLWPTFCFNVTKNLCYLSVNYDGSDFEQFLQRIPAPQTWWNLKFGPSFNLYRPNYTEFDWNSLQIMSYWRTCVSNCGEGILLYRCVAGRKNVLYFFNDPLSVYISLCICSLMTRFIKFAPNLISFVIFLRKMETLEEDLIKKRKKYPC